MREGKKKREKERGVDGTGWSRQRKERKRDEGRGATLHKTNDNNLDLVFVFELSDTLLAIDILS